MLTALSTTSQMVWEEYRRTHNVAPANFNKDQLEQALADATPGSDYANKIQTALIIHGDD